ncbi:MAG: hypothetical protein WD404_04375 [Solirubrobacterales bacterium]
MPGVEEALLEGRAAAMHATGLAEAWVEEDGERCYELTEWGREAIVHRLNI